MNSQDIQQDIGNIKNRAEKVYSTMFEKKAIFENLDKQLKTNLSRIKLTHTGSDASKETNALASDEYQEFLGGWKAANTNYNHALAKVKAMEVELACCQSLAKFQTHIII